MNVLVYSGPGTTAESVKHCLESLRLHLSPSYAVVAVLEHALVNDPWMHKTSTLVLPGGADLPYCRVLNGEGNRKIARFVQRGGNFVGFCAGGYYAAAKCQFEVGTPMEVSGPRELAFFPGTARGCVYKGFVYETQCGAKAARLVPEGDADGAPLYNYYNGGGCFVDAAAFPDTEVLARYADPVELDADEDCLAAVVLCKVGRGRALLTGTHPEYTPALLKAPAAADAALAPGLPYARAYAVLADAAHDRRRRACMRDWLLRLGLRVNDSIDALVPQLTPIYVTSLKPEAMLLMQQQLGVDRGGLTTMKDAHDVFVLHGDKEGHLMLAEPTEPPQGATSATDAEVPDASDAEAPDATDAEVPDATDAETPATAAAAAAAAATAAAAASAAATADLDTAPKHVKFCAAAPPYKLTPYFNINTYLERLRRLSAAGATGAVGAFGTTFGYAEVVTSTNTLLDKNPALLQHLPHGFTLTATTQVAGRGRGGNVWVNPRGVMATLVVFKIPVTNSKALIVTLQYLCGLALVELILAYGSDVPGAAAGYEEMPIRLKWPNDIYLMKPQYFERPLAPAANAATLDEDEEMYAKILGALLNSQYLNRCFHLVWGVGVNVSNLAPTTLLNLVLDKLNALRARRGLAPLPHYQHEVLLAKMLYTVEQFYAVFAKAGIKPFLPLYYKRWFHLGQRVLVDAAGDGRQRQCLIKGITEDHGLLVVEDVATGEVLELQPDGNSFDIFRGLIYRK